jgi:hypothetical protein
VALTARANRPHFIIETIFISNTSELKNNN